MVGYGFSGSLRLQPRGKEAAPFGCRAPLGAASGAERRLDRQRSGVPEAQRVSVPEKRPSLSEELDDIDDPRKSAGVEVVKSALAHPDEEEVLEEVREPGYLWEGPCESSSSSSTAARGEEFSEEEEMEEFPREEYIHLYRTLFYEKIKLGKKNIILQKQMHEYCKKRKLEVYFEEIETPDPKLEAKYARQLTAIEEFVALEEKTHVTLKEELEKLELDKIEAEQDLERVIEELLATEKNTGSGLISAANGKPLGEKAREYTGDLKKQRDALRAKLVQMRQEAGLLVHQRLLRDFERRIEESQALTVEIENLKNNFSDQNERLTRVRESIVSMRRSEMDAYEQDIHMYQAAMIQRRGGVSAAGETRKTLEKIKKGSPFFPTGKLSKIVKYVGADGRSKLKKSLTNQEYK